MQHLTDISRCEAVVATYYVAETIEAQYHARHRYGLVRGQYVSSTSEVSASRTPRHGVSLMIQHIVASRQSFNASTFGTFPLGYECAFCVRLMLAMMCFARGYRAKIYANQVQRTISYSHNLGTPHWTHITDWSGISTSPLAPDWLRPAIGINIHEDRDTGIPSR